MFIFITTLTKYEQHAHGFQRPTSVSCFLWLFLAKHPLCISVVSWNERDHLLVRAFITKYHSLVGLNNRNLFSQQRLIFSPFWRLRSLRLRCGMKGREGGRERMSSLVLRFKQTLILLDQGLTLMPPFNLTYFLRGPISSYSHIGF